MTNEYLVVYELTKTLKHFLNGVFLGLHHNTLLIQHQDIHGQPFRGHPQRVVYRGKNDSVLFWWGEKIVLLMQDKITWSLSTNHQKSRVLGVSQQSSQPS